MAGSNQEPKIVIRRVRKGGHGGHHGGAWKVAYADFVTAMMAFFMLLWLVSNPDEQRLKGLAEYFSPEPPAQASGNDGAKIPLPSPMARASKKSEKATETAAAPAPDSNRGGRAAIPDATLRVMAQEMKVQLDSIPEVRDAPESVQVEAVRDGIRISLMDSARRSMFKAGTAEFNAYARALVIGIADKLARSKQQIAIEGHTDSAGGQSDTNWRLSSDRALAARAVMAGRLSPDRFAQVVGMAGAEPIYPDQPDRPENRRISIVVLAGASALPSDTSFEF